MSKFAGLITALLALANTAQAAGEQFVENRDYTVVQKAVSPGGPRVVEFFSYSCPHCYSAEELVSEFVADKPDDIRFERVPVGFNRKDWELSKQAYIIKEILGLGNDVHRDIFAHIHDRQSPFGSLRDVQAFFEFHGVGKDDFDTAANSFSADSQIRAASKKVRDNRISQVPTFIINDRYVVKMDRQWQPAQLNALFTYLATKDSPPGE